MTGLEMIAAERKRLDELRGSTVPDDSQPDGDLIDSPIMAGLALGNDASLAVVTAFSRPEWITELARNISKDDISRLALAGALIAAEMDKRLGVD